MARTATYRSLIPQPRSRKVHDVVFTNRSLFPPYEHLPLYELHNRRSYRPTWYKRELGIFLPIRPWFFLGEIVDATHALNAECFHAIIVKDVDNRLERIKVEFYLSKSIDIDYTSLKKGHTVCINFGCLHMFTNNLVRVDETYKKVTIFPASLKTLLTIVSSEIKNHIPLKREKTLEMKRFDCLRRCMKKAANPDYKPPSPPPGPRPPHCWQCGKEENDELKMKHCSKCHLATYCEKACQISHWDSTHKSCCKSLVLYTPLVESMKKSLDILNTHIMPDFSPDPTSDEEEESEDEQVHWPYQQDTDDSDSNSDSDFNFDSNFDFDFD